MHEKGETYYETANDMDGGVKSIQKDLGRKFGEELLFVHFNRNGGNVGPNTPIDSFLTLIDPKQKEEVHQNSLKISPVMVSNFCPLPMN